MANFQERLLRTKITKVVYGGKHYNSLDYKTPARFVLKFWVFPVASQVGEWSYPRKLPLYAFHHVFFVCMCTLVRSRHMGKPNLINACLF